MSDRTFLCRCEDVTSAELEHALASGLRTIEELKRYTGFGTGPCQGKECHALVAITLASQTGAAPASIEPFTSRSPISPTPLGLLAATDDES